MTLRGAYTVLYSAVGLEHILGFFAFIFPADRKEIEKKIIALTSSTRSIDLRREKKLVTFSTPPFSYVHLLKPRCERWRECKKGVPKHPR